MTADVVYLVAGASLLAAIILPSLVHRWAVSAPMVLLAVGVAIGWTPLLDDLSLSPASHRAVIEHVTEFVVIVALMGVGLALDRPLNPRSRSSWVEWGSTWRVIAIAMPLCIGAVAVLGLSVGLSVGSALLLGAALAPTDPVLASDVQVAGPRTGGHEVGESDEVRFTLTSEAGLNDGLAFPFVHLAILVATARTEGSDWVHWLGWYAAGKVALGVAAGIAVGWVLAQIAFRSSSRSLRFAERGESLASLAALAAAYGLTELVGGYGFLGVFVCAMTFRSVERSHDYHAQMHEVAERLERVLTLILLLVLGIALSRGLLAALDWRGVLVALGLVVVIRPLAGVLAFTRTGSSLAPSQRWAVAFFGVRGVGSFYYLAYAAGEVPGFGTGWMWATVALTVTASVLIHGVLAAPVMRRIGELRD